VYKEWEQSTMIASAARTVLLTLFFAVGAAIASFAQSDELEALHRPILEFQKNKKYAEATRPPVFFPAPEPDVQIVR
jgi:hypothetical protein